MADATPLPDDQRAADARPAAGLTGHGPYRYAAWDGRQRLAGIEADELVGALADDLLTDGDVDAALARLFQRGFRPGQSDERLAGLAELRARLARRRQQLLSRFDLGGVLDELRDELEGIIATERRGLDRRLAGSASGDVPDSGLADVAASLAARRQDQLAELPQDVAGRIRALSEYDFLEPAARERFEALLDRLRRQVLDSYFAGLSEAIGGTTPEALTANREMVRDLNRLLQQRLAGEPADASDFLARHGQFFPGARSLDDVIEQLAQRMAAMQSLLASLSAEQRRELQAMMDALLRDDRLRWDLAQLAATLDQLLPDGLGRRYDFGGSEPLTIEGALEQLARLGRYDALSEQLGEVQSAAGLDAIDEQSLAELAGEEAAADLRALKALADRLAEAGYVERRGDELKLTARGMRRIGQGVLDELFGQLRRDVFGGHERDALGLGGERGESSRAYEFGRPFDVDLPRTLANALARGRPLAIEPADFAIHDTEARTRVAIVLLVDMSRSMLLRGCFLAAKKVAIALDTLIRTRFPHDELDIVGFAYYARQVKPQALAALSWHGYEYGTNLQHGLLLARELLNRSHASNRQIIVVTDGEPTAHFEDGQVEFSYPPTRRTLDETLREVARCTRAGITINTFMLERSRALAEFVERMTRLNRGRAFYATPERLGEYVLVDYVGRRTKAA